MNPSLMNVKKLLVICRPDGSLLPSLAVEVYGGRDTGLHPPLLVQHAGPKPADRL